MTMNTSCDGCGETVPRHQARNLDSGWATIEMWKSMEGLRTGSVNVTHHWCPECFALALSVVEINE